MREPLKVFITYSHKDPQENEDLKTHLAVMEKKGEIKIWDDNEILPGDEWYKDISNNLPTSDILLYLVSSTSLASENCNKELAEALSEKIRVIPIILEDCDWQNHEIGELQALPDKGKPINEWRPKNRGWQNVVKGIRKIVNAMRSEAETPYAGEDEANVAIEIGNFLQILGQTDWAINRFSHAIEISPNNARAYTNRGAAYYLKGDLDSAIKDLNKAIAFDGGYSRAYVNRGIVYSSKGDLGFAIEDYNKAIELDPNNHGAYNNRGVAYQRKGDLDAAIEDYNKAIELDPNHFRAYHNRGAAYDAKGDLDACIRDYSKAIALKPNYCNAYNNRGVAYQQEGDLDAAIEDYNKAIELDPNDSHAYNNRGTAYYLKGDVNSAIEDYIKATELDPNYVDPYNNLVIIYSERGENVRSVVGFNPTVESEF